MTTKNKGQCYIFGEWMSGYGAPFTSKNPATGDSIWEGPSASVSDVGRSVKAARQALPRWSNLSIDKRVEVVRAFAKHLDTKKEEFARLISKENGKPLWESRAEVGAMIAKVDISIEAFHERTGTKKNPHPAGQSFTRHKPHGVLAVLGPFNFPGHLPNGHIIPALIAGNTIVFKPSEQCPAVGEKMVRIWEEVGLPAGVLNLIQGEAETGKVLVNHPDLNGLLFTGSYGTGEKFSKLFGKMPSKILALEMGGNNPLVVGTVNDLKATAYQIIQSAFITSGQRCTCARRLILFDPKTSEPLLEELLNQTKSISVGPYTDDPEPFMGPVINEDSAIHLLSTQAAFHHKGGIPLLSLTHSSPSTGFVTPGIMDMSQVREIPDEEIFGPFLQVYSTRSLEESIRLANETNYGLAAGILSDSEKEYRQFYDHIQAGCINWNAPTTGASSKAPFGGIGKSGNHRPSAYYAADYCSYPVASVEASKLTLPDTLSPGLTIDEK